MCKNEGICSLHQLLLQDLTEEDISFSMHTKILICVTQLLHNTTLFIMKLVFIQQPLFESSNLISQKVLCNLFYRNAQLWH